MDSFVRLRKDRFPKKFTNRGDPSVSIYGKGKIYFNRAAVEHLGLLSPEGVFGGVDFFQNPEHPAEFAITHDDSGWLVRWGPGRGAEFNNKNLACHIIQTIWDNTPHAAVNDDKKPESLSFRIAHLPIDDLVNKNNFALICKKRYL